MEEPLALFLCAKFNEEIMKQAPVHLVNLIEPLVEGLGYECVGIEYNPHPKHGLLRIYIDSANGILVEDCSKVSHQVSGVLDVEDPIQGNYQLEVSSPGAERPFFHIHQFEKFIGSTVFVSLYQAIADRKKITGVIEKVVDNIIILREADQVFEVPFEAMSKARLVPDYLQKKGGRNGK
jgi:ribosome maturation factor RimP